MDPAPRLPIKYRASCDRCYLAKVKCSKERPTCPRCENLGLACSYSPSQRTGKSRRTKIRRTSAPQDSESQTAFSSQPSPEVPTNASIQSFERSSLQPDSGSPRSQSNVTMATWPSSETIMHDLDVNFLGPLGRLPANIRGIQPSHFPNLGKFDGLCRRDSITF